MHETKEYFKEKEGVNFVETRLFISQGLVLKGNINIKKCKSIFEFFSKKNDAKRGRFLKIAKCHRGGYQAEFESISTSSLMYVEVIKSKKLNISEKLLHEIVVIFQNGKSLTGKIIFDANKYRRLSDCIDNLDNFFPLFVNERIIIINTSINGPLEAIRHK
jgi:hypothetical protein